MNKLMGFWKGQEKNKSAAPSPQNAPKATKKDEKKDKDDTKTKDKDWAKFVPEANVPVEVIQRDPTLEEVKLHVTSSKDPESSDTFVHVSIQSAEGSTRTPLDVCCVVDVSGSMDTAVEIKNESGQAEGHGLTILDVVKHSVKTIIHSLEPCDRITVIAFESSPHEWFPLTQVTATNKEYLQWKVDQMYTMGGTNLWKGLETGMEGLLKIDQKEREKRLPTLFVLTDGIPDFDPSEKLKQYKDEKKKLPNLNTFGFGYSLQTHVLLNIAKQGNGMHAFIPDASFVGTAFVNAISNLMSTNAINVSLSVEPENGVKIQEVLGHESLETSWGQLINMCSLQYGQSKDVVFRVTVPDKATPKEGNDETTAEKGEETNAPMVRVTLKYERAVDPQLEDSVVEAEHTFSEDGGVALEINKLRLRTAACLTQLTKTPDEAIYQKLLEEAQKMSEEPHGKAILEDISGQVKEAIQRTPENYFGKWGGHYLPSLSRAHLLQQCNNFKDPGIQFYGGKIFHDLRDKIEEIFIALPPPKPSATRYGGGYGGGATSAPLASMSTYYNCSGGCIAGECVVSMANGSKKQVNQIVKGDMVASSITGAGSSAEVVCVVKTHCANGRESLVTLPGGLRLTPYHPVHKEDGWHFPLNLAVPQRDADCEHVYNFVLRGDTHAMVVNGVECVTLGHGLSGDVVGHAYFGTQRVVDDLRNMRGFAQGCVELYPAAHGGKTMVRDEKTGLVSGFVQGVDAIPIQNCEM